MAATIMELNPWKTPLELFNEILSGEETPCTEAMQHGKDTEPEARGWICDRLQAHYRPICAEHSLIPWMGASLDGYSEYASVPAIEIKCPMQNWEAIAEMDVVPQHYYAQIQHQMCVLDIDKMYYVVYCKQRQDGVLLKVKRDELFIEAMIEKEKAFYLRLAAFDAPDPIPGRDVLILDDPEATNAAELYSNNKRIIETLEKENEVLKDLMVSKADGHNVKIRGLTISKVVRPGAVDYKKIPALQGLDLAPYRKSNIVYWRVS
jgi:putative phage-type endonuclease